MTAYQVLHRTAKAKRGETVLVHGAAGRVGVAASSWERWPGFASSGPLGSRPRKGRAARCGGDRLPQRGLPGAGAREEAGGVDVVSTASAARSRCARSARCGPAEGSSCSAATHAQGRAQGLAGGDQVVRGDRGRLALGQAVAPPAGVRLPRPEVPRQAATRREAERWAGGPWTRRFRRTSAC